MGAEDRGSEHTDTTQNWTKGWMLDLTRASKIIKLLEANIGE